MDRPELRARFAAAVAETAPPLLRTLDQFVRAQSWDESQRIVEANPDLLTDEADELLGTLIAGAEQRGDGDAVRVLSEHRTLLHRCREAGATRAFAEKVLPPEALAEAARMGLAPEEFMEMQRAAEQMPPELREVLAELAAAGVAVNSPQNLEQALAARPDLRAKLEAAAGAAGGGPDVPPKFRDDFQRVQQGVQCYQQTGDGAALDAAAAAWARILDHPDFGKTDARFQLVALNDSGGVFLRRYWRQGRIEDLNRALASWLQAVTSTPPDSPDRPSRLNNLGTGLRSRYARTGRMADLEEAIRVYRETCRRGLEVAPEEAVRGSRNWGNWALNREEWHETIGAYQYAFDATEQLLSVQLQRAGKEAWLREVQGVPARTTFARAKLGDLQTAVIALENGRARLLAEALESTRANLEALPALGHKAEYDHFIAAVKTGEHIRQQLQTPVHEQPPGFDRAALLAELETAETARKAAIVAIQQIEGYEDFFKPVTFDKITAAAQDTPLVYLLMTPQGGLALIVHGDSVDARWLEYSEDDLRTLISDWFTAYARSRTDPAAWFETIDQSTNHLWTRIMGPLAAALAPLQPQSVTLIPTGLLALLPLHAAWTEDETKPSGRRYFLDEVAVAYAPSATGLGHAREAATAYPDDAVDAAGLLAVAEPRPVNGPRLPNVRLEVAAIADLFDQKTVLAEAEATRQAVLDALPGRAAAHFSCHGLNNWDDPLATGLYMANNTPLTVRDLMGLTGSGTGGGGRLASLSACETGIIGGELPDEVVAFPAALLQAGYAGVAASLWSVADVSTAMLMARFYALWRREGMAPVHAMRAAQRWVRDSTNGEKAAYFGQHVPALAAALDKPDAQTVKMAATIAADFFSAALSRPGGKEARAFAHPFWWAAFTFSGV